MVSIVRKSSIIKELLVNKITSNQNDCDENTADEQHNMEINSTISSRRSSRKLSLQQSLNLSKEEYSSIKNSDAYLAKLSEYEEKSLRLCPKVEGRIVCIKDKNVNKFFCDFFCFNKKFLN